MLTHGIPPDFRAASNYLFKPPYTIGSVPSLSGYAIAYRWRSLPRVHRHRASSPQGSSSNGCCHFAGHHGQINLRLSFRIWAKDGEIYCSYSMYSYFFGRKVTYVCQKETIKINNSNGYQLSPLPCEITLRKNLNASSIDLLGIPQSGRKMSKRLGGVT